MLKATFFPLIVDNEEIANNIYMALSVTSIGQILTKYTMPFSSDVEILEK